MPINKKCRYLTCGCICTLTETPCNNCEKSTAINYKYSYNPFTDVTRISIQDRKGQSMISAEITGQLQPIAVKSYAVDLAKILIDKGVIK